MYLAFKNGVEAWFPKSTIHNDYDGNQNLNEQELLIDNWILVNKGVIDNPYAIEFKVNDYIMLKLEEERTRIYVSGEFADTCIYNPFNENNSTYDLDPELLFSKYCSDFKIWVENEYDTSLLNYKNAFSVLEVLKNIGDPIANKLFRKEIIKTFNSANQQAILYLIKCKYNNQVDKKEINTLFEDPNSKFCQVIKKQLNNKNSQKTYFNLLEKLIKAGYSGAIKVIREEMLKILESFYSADYDYSYYPLGNCFKYLSKEDLNPIANAILTKPSNYDIFFQEITNDHPYSIEDFHLVDSLFEAGDDSAMEICLYEVYKRAISGMRTAIHFLVQKKFYEYYSKEENRRLVEQLNSKGFKCVTYYGKLLYVAPPPEKGQGYFIGFFYPNKLEISEIMCEGPEEVVELHLSENKISSLVGIEKFKNLKTLALTECGIQDIEELADLKELEVLILGINKISDASPIEDLTKLRVLDLSVNYIRAINVENLINLEELYLGGNPLLKERIRGLKKLKNLETLDLNGQKEEEYWYNY